LPGLLGWNGKDTGILHRAGQVIAQQMLEEAADGGTPAVARRCRVRAAGLDVIEEDSDRVRVESLDHQCREVPVMALCDEFEQQLQRISVGTNSVGACPSLARQILDEERFDEREQLTAGRPRHCGGRA
jgi:hypothetical protein